MDQMQFLTVPKLWNKTLFEVKLTILDWMGTLYSFSACVANISLNGHVNGLNSILYKPSLRFLTIYIHRNYIYLTMLQYTVWSGIYQNSSRIRYEYRNSSLYLCQIAYMLKLLVSDLSIVSANSLSFVCIVIAPYNEAPWGIFRHQYY